MTASFRHPACPRGPSIVSTYFGDALRARALALSGRARKRSRCFALTIAIAFLALTGIAHAQTLCSVSWDDGKRALDRGFEMVEVKGSDKDRFIQRFNAAEPKTDFHPDQLFLFWRSDLDQFLVVMVTGGCVIESGRLPAEAIPLFFGEVGTPS